MSDVLDDEEIEAGLPDGWARDGDEIARTFEFDSYLEGVGFASGAAGIAEEAFHHPEMTIGWREAGGRFTTHDARGIPGKGLHLAGRVDELAE